MPGLHRRTVTGMSDNSLVVAGYAGNFPFGFGSTGRRTRPSIGHADRLGLQVFLVSLFAVAIAEAALLGAAERAGDSEVALAVDGDVAGADPLGHLECPADVGAADLAGQPVDGVVGDPDGLVVGAIRRDGQHGAENLL